MRKRRILQAIVNEYIDTAEPVGSRYIAKKHELGLSSATIRNEMADLEDMGYLAQPHASSGRVPSDKGYRLYVDDLMETRLLTLDEVRAVTEELDLKINELGALIKNASAAISRLTKYTAVTLTTKGGDSGVKAVETVSIDSAKVYVIVISESGTVKNSIASLPVRLDKDDLARLTALLQNRVCGHSRESLMGALQSAIREEFAGAGAAEAVMSALADAVIDCLRQMGSAEMFLEGTANILNFPEFRNIERAREFLEILEEKKSIANLLSGLAKDERVRVLIGGENQIDEIKECSIVSATYTAGNMVFGTIGVIGPKRMEYSKVVSTIEYINKVIASELGKLASGADEG
ncbi:MAG: heat-inducible transcriptional repressor HrcA [Clostridiales bacterium]|nr:heat-inducible transcriptional repressor HrcA [Clostridiales bacterium]